MSRLYCFALLSDCGALSAPDAAAPFDPPRLVRVSDFHALVSPVATDALPPKRRFLRAHTHLLEKLHPRATVLPMRFGTIAPSLDALKSATSQNREDIARLFNRLERCTEYGLTISTSREALLRMALELNVELQHQRDSLASSGRVPTMTAMHFGQRLSDAAASLRRRLEKVLLSRLSGVTSDIVLRAPEADEDLLRADVLVSRPNEDAFTTLLSRIEQETADGTQDHGLLESLGKPVIRLIGPSPMFSFAHCRLSFEPAQNAGGV